MEEGEELKKVQKISCLEKHWANATIAKICRRNKDIDTKRVGRREG